jgi:hypothetical protein
MRASPLKCVSVTSLALLSAALLLPAQPADARPGVRGSASTSMQRAPAARSTGAPGGNAAAQRNVASNRVDTTRVSGGNRVNTGNVRVGNDVNVNVDNNNGWGDWDDDYHPVARGMAVGTAAAVTAAAIGSMTRSLPAACGTQMYGGTTYYNCSGTWYAPQYQGDQVVYVVVENPG